MIVTIATGDVDSSGTRINLDGIKFTNPVIVLEEFDYHIPIGKAIVYQEGTNLLKAIITTHEDYRFKADASPAIGFKVIERSETEFIRSELYAIGICMGENQDENIKPLGIQCPDDKDIIYPSKPAI